MKTKADTSPEATQKMIAAFGAFGVTKEQIEKRIQRRLDSIQPAQVVSLKKIYTSLRDGMSSPADWFEFEEAGTFEKKSGTDALKEKMREQVKQQAPSEPIDSFLEEMNKEEGNLG